MAETRDQSIVKVIRQYSQRLFGFIRGRVSREEDAEDILQEVWYQLTRVVDIEELQSISGWLFQTARSKIIDRYRKKKDLILDEGLFEQGDGFSDIMLETDRLPEDEFFKEVFWEELMAALDELPPNQREVFVKHELEGMTLQEIAEEQQDKLKTVISRKRYAVQHLKRRLQQLYDELNDL